MCRPGTMRIEFSILPFRMLQHRLMVLKCVDDDESKKVFTDVKVPMFHAATRARDIPLEV